MKDFKFGFSLNYNVKPSLKERNKPTKNVFKGNDAHRPTNYSFIYIGKIWEDLGQNTAGRNRVGRFLLAGISWRP